MLGTWITDVLILTAFNTRNKQSLVSIHLGLWGPAVEPPL